LKAVVDDVQIGWAILCLYAATSIGGCGCGNPACESPGKHPRTANGLHDASKDEKQVRTWWGQYPNANVGVATGAVSGIFVVDLDGFAACLKLLKLEQTYGDLPETLTAATSRDKGFHLYFRYPTDGPVPSSVGRVAEGIDVRGDGGYVVAPPSIGVTGNQYHWVNDEPICEAPSWLLRLARGPLRNSSVKAVPALIKVFMKGTRNDSLTREGGSLRYRGFGLQAIEAALKGLNRAACVPPLDEREVERIAASVARYAPSKSVPAVDPPELHFYTGSEIAGMVSGDVQWLAKPWIAVGSITEVDGKVKVAGKTTFLTRLARAVINGSEFLGEETLKSKVVYLTEQPVTSFREALRRAELLDEDDFHGLFIHDTMGIPWTDVVKSTVRKALELEAKLIVIDTLPRWARMRGETENSAGDAAQAIEPLKDAVSKHDLAVVFARHERKAGGEVGDSGRGSSAFGGEVDVIVAVRRAGGAYPYTVRKLLAVGRFDETPENLLIDLTDEGYSVLGTAETVERDSVKAEVLECLPDDPGAGIALKTILEETGASRSTAQRALAELERSGEVCHQPGGGQNPKLYRKPATDADTNLTPPSDEKEKSTGDDNPDDAENLGEDNPDDEEDPEDGAPN
jgi:hypothetical protein